VWWYKLWEQSTIKFNKPVQAQIQSLAKISFSIFISTFTIQREHTAQQTGQQTHFGFVLCFFTFETSLGKFKLKKIRNKSWCMYIINAHLKRLRLHSPPPISTCNHPCKGRRRQSQFSDNPRVIGLGRSNEFRGLLHLNKTPIKKNSTQVSEHSKT
jgi:hypothetical protein